MHADGVEDGLEGRDVRHQEEVPEQRLIGVPELELGFDAQHEVVLLAEVEGDRCEHGSREVDFQAGGEGSSIMLMKSDRAFM